MKQMLKIALCVMLSLACLLSSALAEETIKLTDVTAEGTYTANLKRLARMAPEGLKDHYKVQQGCATDGTYGYFILESQIDYKCSLWKTDLATWEVLDVRYELPLDHGNDMTYNPKLNQLVVVHNKPRYNMISFVDPETLEIVDSKELSVNMFSIAYNETRDQYVVGLSGSKDFAILDSEFNVIETHMGKDLGYTTQGCDCDDTYIYFPMWDKPNYANYIFVYDWDGNFINTVKLKSMDEVESMCHVGDQFYIAFYAAVSYVYEPTFIRK